MCNPSTKEIHHWVRLSLSRKFNGRQVESLYGKHGSMDAVVGALVDEREVDLVPSHVVDRELDFCHREGVHIVTWMDRRYPELLRQCRTAPILLWVKGNADLLAGHNLISLVGSRNASACGVCMAKKITNALGEHNFVTVSGLARGIDTIIHTQSLETGTIAILGTGLDVIYPRSNGELFHKIAHHGALVSELPHRTGPNHKYFPIRNRIIAGMSAGMVVVEARKRSGSTLSAQYALNYGRRVMAVPGSPLDPNYGGCLELIKNGAEMVNDMSEMIMGLNDGEMSTRASPLHGPVDGDAQLGDHGTIGDSSCGDRRLTPTQEEWNEMQTLSNESPRRDRHNSQDNFPRDSEDFESSLRRGDREQVIMDLLSHTPVDINHIVQITNFSVSLVQAIICKLRLENKIIQQGSHVSLKPGVR